MAGAAGIRGWVGDREPGPDDVQRANELPQAAWLHQYRTNLLASLGKTGHTPRLRRLPFQQIPRQPDACTYPLQCLYDIPDPPSRQELDDLRNVFTAVFASQDFLQAYHLPGPESALSPHLELAYAAIGALVSLNQDTVTRKASQLFNAGVRICAVMLETNNVETRSPSAVLSASLFATFGVLSANLEDRNWGVSWTGYALAMLRRLPRHEADQSPEAQRKRHALTCYLMLLATVQSLIYHTSPMMSSEEMTMLPGADRDFTREYSRLFLADTAFPTQPSQNVDNALVLLSALMSAIMFVEQSYQTAATQHLATNGALSDSAYPVDLITGSATRGRTDSHERISRALQRWRACFGSSATSEILAWSYYLELRLTFCDIGGLLRECGYLNCAAQGVASPESTASEVTDHSVRLAWIVLDHVDTRHRSRQCFQALWLPPVLFHAGLVIWKSQTQSGEGIIGSLKALDLFARELDALPWPCCEPMAACLRRLQVPSTRTWISRAGESNET